MLTCFTHDFILLINPPSNIKRSKPGFSVHCLMQSAWCGLNDGKPNCANTKWQKQAIFIWGPIQKSGKMIWFNSMDLIFPDLHSDWLMIRPFFVFCLIQLSTAICLWIDWIWINELNEWMNQSNESLFPTMFKVYTTICIRSDQWYLNSWVAFSNLRLVVVKLPQFFLSFYIMWWDWRRMNESINHQFHHHIDIASLLALVL